MSLGPEPKRIAIFAYGKDKPILESEGVIVGHASDAAGQACLVIRTDKPYETRLAARHVLAITGDGRWKERTFHTDDSGPPWSMAEVVAYALKSDDVLRHPTLDTKDLIPLEDAYVVQAYAIDELAPLKHDSKSLARYNMARRLMAWCLSRSGIDLGFDEESLGRLDDAIRIAHPAPIPESEVGTAVAPWASYLLEVVSRVLKGDIISIPWDGEGVLAGAPSGWTRLVETTPRVWNRLSYGGSHSISAWWEKLREDLATS